MVIYNYDKNGELLNSALADESPLQPGVFLVPAFATNKVPPITVNNQVAIFENNNWVVKSDFRGQLACEVDANKYFIKLHNVVIGDEPSATLIFTNPPVDVYKPKWNGVKWIDGEIRPASTPTIEEQLEALNELILSII